MVSSRACPVLHGEPGPAKGNIVVILISTGTRNLSCTLYSGVRRIFFFGGGRGDPASESDEDNEKKPG